MAADPNYIPRYIKPNLESVDECPTIKEQEQKLKILLKAFEQKFQKNVNI